MSDYLPGLLHVPPDSGLLFHPALETGHLGLVLPSLLYYGVVLPILLPESILLPQEVQQVVHLFLLHLILVACEVVALGLFESIV